MDKRKENALQVVLISIIGSFLLALIKGLTGLFGNSYALIADAIESTTDIFSSFLVFLGIRYSHKPADENHPYGHGKIEPLVTFVVVFFLVLVASIIVYKSIENIQTPHQTPAPYTLIVLGIVIVVKEVFYHFIAKKGEEAHSTSLQADAWHHRSDAITSLMAFIGIAFALYMGEGYENADDWAALFASGFIFYNAFLIFRPALGEIMDEHRYDELELCIRKTAIIVKGVIATEKCFIRKTGMFYYVDLHLIVSGKISVKEGHEIAHSVKQKIQKEYSYIADILIHIEPD